MSVVLQHKKRRRTPPSPNRNGPPPNPHPCHDRQFHSVWNHQLNGVTAPYPCNQHAFILGTGQGQTGPLPGVLGPRK
eukprot:5987149-Ditylum_brightwellii.AAC.1